MHYFTNCSNNNGSSHWTDDDLIVFVARGDDTAFAELYARYQKRVAYIVRRHFQRADEVEELVQLIFIEVWTSIHKFRGESTSAFAAWLARLATNTCYDELRRQHRNRESVMSQFGDDDDSDWCESRPAFSCEQHIEHLTVARDLLDKLLVSLEPPDRQVFVMLKAQDHSIAEISLVTGWSEAKIKMRIRRSRSILQRRSRKLI
ncbi:MAG: RNA polymerase sigma factor [Blastocatellia bacterium]|nr:RNA polymerase sigma factor [Blastocatellia bacterium]